MQLRHLRRREGEEEETTSDTWREEEPVSSSGYDLLFHPSDSSSSTDGFLLYDFILHPCLVVSCDYDAEEYNVSTSPLDSGAAPAAAESSYYVEKDSSPWTSSFDTWEVASFGTVAGMISLVTIIGNLIVILSFILERSIRQTSNYFIASLAVSDLLIGCISMPLYTVYLLSDQTWLLGETLCDLWLALDYTLCLCSIYTVFCITIDRYCSVTLTAKYRKWRTERKVLVIVAITWLVPVLVFFPSIMGWQYFVDGGRTVPGDKCYVQYMENALFNCLLQVGYFWATLVVMCALYAGIYRVALRLHRKAESRRRRMVSLVSVAGETITRIGIGMTRSAAAARRGISIPMLPLRGGGGGSAVISNHTGTTTTSLKRLESYECGDDDDEDEWPSSLGFDSRSGPEPANVRKRGSTRKGDRVLDASDVVVPSRMKSLTTMVASSCPGKTTLSPSFLESRVSKERPENQYTLLPTEDLLEEAAESRTATDTREVVVDNNTAGKSQMGKAPDERMEFKGGKRVIIRQIGTGPNEVEAAAAKRTGVSGFSCNFAKRDADHKSGGRKIDQSTMNHYRYHSPTAADAEAGKSSPDTNDKQFITCSGVHNTTTGPRCSLLQDTSHPGLRRQLESETNTTNRRDLSPGRRRTNEDVQQTAVAVTMEEQEEMRDRRRMKEERMTDGRGSSYCLAAHHQLGRCHLLSELPVMGDSTKAREGCDSNVSARRVSSGHCGCRDSHPVSLSAQRDACDRKTTCCRCKPVRDKLPDREEVSAEDDFNGPVTATRNAQDAQDIDSAMRVWNDATCGVGSGDTPAPASAAVATVGETTLRQMVVSSRNHVSPSDAWKGTPPSTNYTTRCLPHARGRDQVTLQRVSAASCPTGRGRWRFSVLRQWSSRKQRSRFFRETSSSSSQKTKYENHARKSVRTITLILGAFVICWTPWHVLSLIMGFCPNAPEGCVPSLLYDISYWLCYLNSPLNPFCYAFANQQFKKTFVRILRLDWRRN